MDKSNFFLLWNILYYRSKLQTMFHLEWKTVSDNVTFMYGSKYQGKVPPRECPL